MQQVELIAEAQLVIEFSVSGSPLPQGSKVNRVSGKRIQTPEGPAILNARAYSVEQSDMKTKTRPSQALQKWRELIASKALPLMEGAAPWEAGRGIELACEFVIARSDSHFTGKDNLKKGAPPFPTMPDISKMVRAVEDAMTGVVYRDDGLISQYGTMKKRYSGLRRGGAGVLIRVTRL